jgi:3-deoxy-D-manno-octulosonic-acid transferase
MGLWWRVVLYNLILHTAVLVMLPWILVQFLSMPKRRVGIRERLGASPEAERKTLWIHAVSVGEVRAVSPMVDLLSAKLKGKENIFLSTVTVTGQGTAQRECGHVSRIFYFPLDLYVPVQRSLDRARPTIFVTTETEIWPNFLYACFARGIPVLMVNGRISDRSFSRYKLFRWFFRPFLRNVSSFLMQSEEDGKRIIDLGAPPDRVRVTGNMKYDMVPKPVDLPESVRKWASDSFLLVAGSTHAGEEEVLLDALADDRLADVRMVIVPRHPERFDDVARLLEGRGLPYNRFSDSNGYFEESRRILLVDAMGVLESCYSLADAAFVGGSLVPVGGHNLLEPAMHGVSVLTGPHLSNFRDIAKTLVDAGGCAIVKDTVQFADSVSDLMVDFEHRIQMGKRARDVSTGYAGASGKNADLIISLL